jgi:hypothetical protein
VLLGVLAIAAMSASLTGPYVFDDVSLIDGNNYVHGLDHWRHWLTGTLWDTNFDPALARESRHFWRPLVLFSYALNWKVGDGSPLPFHITNLLIHALDVGLVTCLLLEWVGGLWPAAVGALLFAVHPVQTEPVAWIAGRTDSLCALGLLIATLGIRVRRSRRIKGLLLQAVGIVVAFASKEQAVVLPVFAAIEIWSEEKRPLDLACVRQVLRRSAPYLGLALAYLMVNRWLVASEHKDLGVDAHNHVPLILEAVGRYTALLFWPNDLALGRAQLHYAHGFLVPNPGYAALGLLSLVVLLTIVWRARRRMPALSLGLLAFLGMLLPVSGLVWLGNIVLVSPRFLYVPMIGMALTVSAAVSHRACESMVARSALLMLLAGLSLRAFKRSADYQTELSFWRFEIEANSKYSPAQQFFIDRELNRGRPRAALQLVHGWFRPALEQGTPDVQAHLVLSALAAALQALPDLDTIGLGNLQRFARGLSRGEPGSLSIPSLGIGLDVVADGHMFGVFRDADQRLWMMAAEAAVRRGDDAAAIELVDASIVRCADCWSLLSNSALILARAHRLDRALELAQRAVESAPPGKIDGIVCVVRDALRWQSLAGSAPAEIVDAGMQSALGAFGRAYRSARRAIENPPSDPGQVLSLAELSFRAGDVASARRLLGTVLPAPEVAAKLSELARTVSWIDRPVLEDDWVPSIGVQG